MKTVIVLFGGASSEKLVSTASAQHIAAELTNARYWFWHPSGAVIETSREELISHQNPFKVLFEPKIKKNEWNNIEVAINVAKKENAIFFLSLHGGDGENGVLQSQLEKLHISFTGSGALASEIAFDKKRSKDMLANTNIKLAQSLCVTLGNNNDWQKLQAFFSEYHNIVAKPQRDGSSTGLAFLSSAAELLVWWKANEHTKLDYIIEERLIGREFTVGVIDINNVIKALALPVSEVVLTNPSASFDYDGKYLGKGTKEITPAEVTKDESEMLQDIALTAHKTLGCYGYSRTDVILTNNGAYFLETNTLPGITRASFIPQQLAAANVKMLEFINMQLNLAMLRTF